MRCLKALGIATSSSCASPTTGTLPISIFFGILNGEFGSRPGRGEQSEQKCHLDEERDGQGPRLFVG